MRKVRIFSLLVSLCGALPAAAQAAAPVCVVFPVKDLSAGTDTRDYEQTITEAVSAALTSGGFTVLPASAWQDAASE